MAQPMRHSQPTTGRRKKSPEKRVVLFDQENATQILRLLQELLPQQQSKIAEAADISQSAVSEWLAGRRNLTFERIPPIAELYGVDPTVFLKPVDELKWELEPCQVQIQDLEEQRREIIAAALSTLERYTKTPAQAHLFEPDSSAGKRRGHLQSVSADPR